MILLYLTWITAAVLVGLLGRRRRFGFWGYLFASLFFSPVVGAVLVLASDPRPRPQQT